MRRLIPRWSSFIEDVSRAPGWTRRDACSLTYEHDTSGAADEYAAEVLSYPLPSRPTATNLSTMRLTFSSTRVGR